MYLQASFEGDNGRNIQIIWDKILERDYLKKNDRFSVKRELNKYAVRDLYRSLRGRTVKISLHAEFMPIFGWITFVSF